MTLKSKFLLGSLFNNRGRLLRYKNASSIYLNSPLTLLLLCSMLFGCEKADQHKVRTIEQTIGSAFTEIRPVHFKPPYFSSLSLPPEENGAASWGATGRDDLGNVYFGVSTYTSVHNTAFLYQLNPSTQKVVFQGDVVTQLKKTGFYSDGVSQNKLHSKFYQADDGYIYFTSFDETGESASKGILPTYGSHIWRKKPNNPDWEHLLATKEALIAINTDGRYIYSLGYWNHVLYQFDTLTSRFNRITVGSVAGHISRNFLVTSTGNVFVPKVDLLPDKSLMINLMEYDHELNLMDTHPLEHYSSGNYNSDHGIISYTNMKNGDIYFITSIGALYRISKTTNSKHNVHFISFIGEGNESGGYFPSLFSLDGEGFLVGFGRLPNKEHYSWFIHELSTQVTVTYDVAEFNNKFLLYGSVTKDNFGNMYVVGVDLNIRSKSVPKILQLSYTTP